MMIIENKYNIGDKVFLITDDEQKERFVTSLLIKPTGILYELCAGSVASYHYDFEISKEENLVKKSIG